MKKLILVLILISVTACTSIEYVPLRLALPAKTLVPALTNKAIECVDQSTYSTLVHRDLAHNFYIGRLEAVIKSTWEDNANIR